MRSLTPQHQLLGFYWLTAALMVGYGAIFSLLAEIRDVHQLTSSGIGFIGAAAFASGFVAQLFLSRFADIGYGSRMLQTGLLICIVSSGAMVFADTLFEWIGSRGALGFGAGLIRPAIRRFIVLFDPVRAGRTLGIVTAYETAGFLVGPVIAALLNTTLGLHATFVVMTLLLVMFIPFVVQAVIPATETPPPPRIMRVLLAKPEMQACLAMGVAFWITIGVFEAIWAVFLSDLGASQIFIGLTMSLFGLPMILISPLAGDMAQKRGSLNIAIFSITAAIICMLTYGLTDSIWLLCLPLAIHAVADAYSMPAIQVAITQASGTDAIAAGQGLYGATGMAVGAITAALAGVIYQEAGSVGLWWSSAGVMAVLMMFAWWRGEVLKHPYGAAISQT